MSDESTRGFSNGMAMSSGDFVVGNFRNIMDTENVAYGAECPAREDGPLLASCQNVMVTENVAHGTVSSNVEDGDTIYENMDTESTAQSMISTAFGAARPLQEAGSSQIVLVTENAAHGIVNPSMGESVTGSEPCYEDDVLVENVAHGRACPAVGNGATIVDFENVVADAEKNVMNGIVSPIQEQVQEVDDEPRVNRPDEDDEASSMTNTQDTDNPPSSRLRMKLLAVGTDQLNESADASKPENASPKPKPGPAHKSADMQNGPDNLCPDYLAIIAPRSEYGEGSGNLNCEDDLPKEEEDSSEDDSYLAQL